MANWKTTDANSLPEAIEALAGFDWGQDAKMLQPIDDAVVQARSDADRKKLAARLSAVLATDASRAVKDYVCRKLSLIGSADVVPSLAALLEDEQLSSSARYALERMSPEAAAAMRAALPKTSGQLKAGVVNSLGRRRDAASADALIGMLDDADPAVAGAAAAALGAIGTVEAASALRGIHAESSASLSVVATDACLECAARLVAAGKSAEAMEIYKALGNDRQSGHVRRAAELGMKAARG